MRHPPRVRVVGLEDSAEYVRRGYDLLRGAPNQDWSKKEAFLRDDISVVLIVKRVGQWDYITVLGACTGGYVEYGALVYGAHHIHSPASVTAGSYQTGSCAPLPDWFPSVQEAIAGSQTSKVYGFPDPPTPLPVTPPPNTNGLDPETAQCLLFPDHCELAQKKYSAANCNPAMSTGKMKLLFQSIMGSDPLKLHMVNDGVYLVTGTDKWYVRYTDTLFRDDEGVYWIVNEGGGNAEVTRLVFSECGQEIVNTLMRGGINASDEGGFPREAEAQLEAYLFTFLVIPHPTYPLPHPDTGEVYRFSVAASGGGIGAGQWHAAYQKRTALRVVQKGGWGAELQELTFTSGTRRVDGKPDPYPPPPGISVVVIDSGEASEEYKMDWGWGPVGGDIGQFQVGGTPDKTYYPVAGTKPKGCFYDFNDQPVVAYYTRTDTQPTGDPEVELQPYCAQWGFYRSKSVTTSGVYSAGYFIVSASGTVDCIRTAASGLAENYEEYHHDYVTAPAYETNTLTYLDPGNTVSVSQNHSCGESEDINQTVVGPGAFMVTHKYGGMYAIAGEIRNSHSGYRIRKGLFMRPFDTVDGFYIAGLQEDFYGYHYYKTKNNTAGHIFYGSGIDGSYGFRWGWDVGFGTNVSSEDRERAEYRFEAYVATPEGVFLCDSGGDSYEGPVALPPPDSYTNPKNIWAQQLKTTDGMFPQVKYAISSGVVTMCEYTAVSGQDRIRFGGHTAGNIFIGWA